MALKIEHLFEFVLSGGLLIMLSPIYLMSNNHVDSLISLSTSLSTHIFYADIPLFKGIQEALLSLQHNDEYSQIAGVECQFSPSLVLTEGP